MYPSEYRNYGNRKRGIYDGSFLGKKGKWKDIWIPLEIWGDNPGRKDNKEYYAETRKQKELFHEKENIFCLGIHWKDCKNEQKLEEIFKPFIGMLPIVNGTNDDKKFDSNLWTLKDIVLAECKTIKEIYGTIPTSSWFNRQGKEKYRVQNRWEFEMRYTIMTLNSKISQIGGIQKVRSILGCENLHNRPYKKRPCKKRTIRDIHIDEIKDLFEEVIMTKLTMHHLPILPLKGNGRRKKKAKITKEMVEKKMAEIYDVHGLEGMTKKWLQNNGHTYMYERMRKELRVTSTKIAKQWNIIDKDDRFRMATPYNIHRRMLRKKKEK